MSNNNHRLNQLRKQYNLGNLKKDSKPVTVELNNGIRVIVEKHPMGRGSVKFCNPFTGEEHYTGSGSCYALLMEWEQENDSMQDTKEQDTKPRVKAYTRVSDKSKGDNRQQREVILKYANENNLVIDEWIEFDHVSGSKASIEERGIKALVDDVKPNDIILVSDIARLGRDNVHSITNTITGITTAGGSIHFCYSKTAITNEDTQDISKLFMAIGEAYGAVKFAQERSQKAKAAHARRKDAGLKSGRKIGTKVRSIFDDHKDFIITELNKGTKKKPLLERLKELHPEHSWTRSRFYVWLEQNKLK